MIPPNCALNPERSSHIVGCFEVLCVSTPFIYSGGERISFKLMMRSGTVGANIEHRALNIYGANKARGETGQVLRAQDS